jgi:urease accessory protein
MSEGEGGLYRVLAWLSPGFPVGAYSYSHGIEAAVEAGKITDRATLTQWIAAILRHGAGRLDADLFRDAWQATSALTPPLSRNAGEGGTRRDSDGRVRALVADDLGPLLAIATRADACRGAAETALESAAQGEAFLATLRAAWPHPLLDAVADALAAEGRPPAYSVAVALALACAGVALPAALTAYLHAVAANLVSAGVRLVPLGQTDGQRALAALEPVVRDCVEASRARSPEEFGACAFAVDLFAIAHETQYTRLFRS